MTAQLAIVIPVLDEAAGLASKLAALAPLRASGACVIVVDGGSSDATFAIASEHADVALQAPPGRASQMNAGAAVASADVLLFLHADTILPKQADVLIARAIADGCDWGRFDVRIDGSQPLLRLVERAMNLRSRLTGIATGDQAMFVRSDVLRAIGGFPAIALMEDIALSRLLKARGRPACLHARVVTSARRWQRDGVLRTIVLMWRLRLAYYFGADPADLSLRYGRQPRRS
ncbi:MAG: TIGR04283 family arsenosugar biosynthesis glycosyltransferase [Betaproteobacteria bacterium]